MQGGTTAAPKQTFDIYRKRSNSTLRVATALGSGLPHQFPAKDWTLVKEPSVLHSDKTMDIAVKGDCYFQLVKD
jgi:hypothetical protein